MKGGDALFEQALAGERLRNAHQIAAFRFYGYSAVLGLQALFRWTTPDWTGAPMLPLAGLTLLAFAIWRARLRFDAYTTFSGLSIVVLDIPTAWWLVHEAYKATLAAGAVEDAAVLLMLLPLVYTSFVLLASLALDNRQTVLAAVAAIALQSWTLADVGRDYTFFTLVMLSTVLVTAMCVYARSQTVRLVRETTEGRLRRERLGRYFSPRVAALVEEGGVPEGGRRQEVTILFADLRGFTTIAESLDPARVVVLLNRFHSAMVDVVFRHGGTLDKYLGDGLMAYFGAPVPQDDQAERAVRCALEMQAGLARLEAQGVAPRGTALRMGIGVNTGPAVVGDIGAESRREFTVIGDAVNVAARLEQLTRELERGILVSGSTVAAAGEAFRFERLESVALRGRDEPVELFVPAPHSS